MPGQEPLIPEILDKIREAKTDNEKISLLQQNGSFALKTILQVAFSPFVNFDFPDTNPPYIPDDSPAGMSPTNLHREVKKFVYFVNGHSDFVESQLNRERIFIQLLEGLHATESELVLSAKAKHIDGLTHEIAWKAFPNVLPEPMSLPIVVFKVLPEPMSLPLVVF